MIKHRCCNALCYTGENRPEEPCWGDVTCIDETWDDEDAYWVHACDGHQPAYEGGKYKPEYGIWDCKHEPPCDLSGNGCTKP